LIRPSTVTFYSTQFTGGTVRFDGAAFTGSEVRFYSAKFVVFLVLCP
jgi:hypothetical protein